MRLIDISPYMVALGPEPDAKKEPFNVQYSLAEILFTDRIAGVQLLKRDTLAQKILGFEGSDKILLEEEEYNQLKSCVEKYEGFGRIHVEFVRRVLEAPSVDSRGLSVVKGGKG